MPVGYCPLSITFTGERLLKSMVTAPTIGVGVAVGVPGSVVGVGVGVFVAGGGGAPCTSSERVAVPLKVPVARPAMSFAVAPELSSKRQLLTMPVGAPMY